MRNWKTVKRRKKTKKWKHEKLFKKNVKKNKNKELFKAKNSWTELYIVNNKIADRVLTDPVSM